MTSSEPMESGLPNDESNTLPPNDPGSPGDLPADEPLTPELLEDEAARGDFTIRWAVVLLAFLLGCTEIGDTQTLVHVKSGEYMLSHGILPPRTDPFSYTTEGRTWVNLGWLFDLLLGTVHAIGGMPALSLLKGALAAATFGFLVHVNLRGVSSWWSSVLAVLALLACHSSFSMRPESITLLGVAVMLWTITNWRQAFIPSLRWLPVLFLVWANLDPRAFLGIGLLLLFATGEFLSAFAGQTTALSEERRRHLAIIVAASFVAIAIHPFGWHAWLSPWTLYTAEYPALRQYYSQVSSIAETQYRSLVSPVFWRFLDHGGVAWLTLVVAAAATQALNIRRLYWGQLTMFVGALGIAVAAAHEIAVSAIVLAVVGTLNAEEWYRTSFRQTWTVTRGEVAFARGGRMLTVLAFVALALVAVLGHLPIPNGERIGVGWQTQLESNLSALREELKSDFDDRPFHTYLRQGDQLIWIGKKSFIDDRILLFVGKNEENLILVHDEARRSLRRPQKPTAARRRDAWKPIFDRYSITHVVPSLSIHVPDYQTVVDLLNDPDWTLDRIGASSAVFYRTDLKDADLRAFLKARANNFVDLAFRRGTREGSPTSEDNADDGRPWPAESTTSTFLGRKPRTVLPAALRQAQHHQRLLQEATFGGWSASTDKIAAIACLMIQECERGLAASPDSAEGFRLQGSAFDLLGTLEATYAASQNGSSLDLRRFYGATLAFAQSLRLEPNQPLIHLRLGELYAARSKLDVALVHLEKAEVLLKASALAKTGDSALPGPFQKLKSSVQNSLKEARLRLDRFEKESKSGSPLEGAIAAFREGCVLAALEMVQSHAAEVDSILPGAILHAQLLLDVGRPWDAEPILLRLEQQMGKEAVSGEWRSLAAIVALSRGDHRHAVELWDEELKILTLEHFVATTESLPMVSRPQSWPLSQIRSANSILFGYPQQAASIRMNLAITHLETGDSEFTERRLREIATETPETSLRPLLRLYLAMASGEVVDLEPPSDQIPITRDLFAPEESPESSPDSLPAEAEIPKQSGI